MTREVRIIRQKTDKRTNETLSGLYVATVGNSIHYFSWLLKGLPNELSYYLSLWRVKGLEMFERFHFRHPIPPYLNGETNRRWRRDTPCKDAKRWPRNNNMATASGGVNSSPKYQLIEEGIPT